MNLESRLEQEARRGTAAIMDRVSVCVTDPQLQSLLRKHVGDVLHNSRRALIKEFVAGIWCEEADVPKASDHSTVYDSAH